MAEMPAVPITLEGAYALHQMFRLRRTQWRSQSIADQERTARCAVELLNTLEENTAARPRQSAVYSQIGHKGDLMLLHFRDSLDELHRVELRLSQLQLSDYLEPVHSYLSVVELGLYESSAKTYTQLSERGFAPNSPDWDAGIQELVQRQATAMNPRLFPEIPSAKYLCFYPMDRKRGEEKNWYTVPMSERQRMMHEHGMIGRRYADRVRQIITGSIGFDDWEWGVDLFADDPLVFKKLIYEMRFDEVSAVYALFGSFFVGVRIRPQDLPAVLAGELP